MKRERVKALKRRAPIALSLYRFNRFRLPVWRADERENVRLLQEIFRSDAPDLLQRDRLDIALERLVMVEAEAVELVERGHVTKRVVALVRDLLLPDQFLFRPRQLFHREPFSRQLLVFLQQSRFHRLNLLRVGPEIKQKQSRNQPLHLARAN